MEPFEHVDAPDPATAAELAGTPRTAALAGGTDLLTEMKSRLRAPERLINLGALDELRGIRETDDAIVVGALATLSELESHPQLRSRVPIVREAAEQAATRQLRNAGTVGGNLCQQVRCAYYRHRGVDCWLKGGERCFAREGDASRHAVLARDESPCIAVHPSDLAPALIALDAQARIIGPDGERTEPVESLYRLPNDDHRRHTALAEDELLAEVRIPFPERNACGTYRKAMERAAWSFALASVAVQLAWSENGDRVARARVVLGGVAGTPWRASGAEQALLGEPLNASTLEDAGERAVEGAEPFAANAYKVPLARNLLKRALSDLAESVSASSS